MASAGDLAPARPERYRGSSIPGGCAARLLRARLDRVRPQLSRTGSQHPYRGYREVAPHSCGCFGFCFGQASSMPPKCRAVNKIRAQGRNPRPARLIAQADAESVLRKMFTDPLDTRPVNTRRRVHVDHGIGLALSRLEQSTAALSRGRGERRKKCPMRRCRRVWTGWRRR